jgi:macrodomain Ter protein organizer (MatP/YcbG family)
MFNKKDVPKQETLSDSIRKNGLSPGCWKRKYDRTEICALLLEWSDKGDSINLSGFCAEYNIPPTAIDNWVKNTTDEAKAISEILNIVKSKIAARRERYLNNNQIHVKCYEKNAQTYDYFMNQTYRENVEFEIKAKILQERMEDKEANIQFDALMKQLSALQSSAEASPVIENIEESNISNEQ